MGHGLRAGGVWWQTGDPQLQEGFPVITVVFFCFLFVCFFFCFFVFFFFAVPGLLCCPGFSLVVASGGYSPVAVHGLLIVVASLVALED